jgi:CxxC motif-containing protein (DUF1111 family)
VWDSAVGLSPPGINNEATTSANQPIAVDTAALPCDERFNEKLGRALFRKELFTDPGQTSSDGGEE